MRILLSAMAIGALGSAAASGQVAATTGPFAVRKCDDPKVPIGLLPSVTGVVSYMVGRDGRPDTTSIGVVKLFGMSVAGFRSVAARQLSGCRFDVDKAALKTAVAVIGEISTDSSSVTVGAATPSTAAGAPLPLEAQAIPKDSFPLRYGDRRIEEAPRRLSCKPGAPGPRANSTATGSATTAAQITARAQAQAVAQSDVNNWNTMNAGTLVAEVRVNSDGSPGTAVRVIEVSNPMAATSLANLLGGCSFVPGRYLGVRVPTFIQTKMVVPSAKVQ